MPAARSRWTENPRWSVNLTANSTYVILAGAFGLVSQTAAAMAAMPVFSMRKERQANRRRGDLARVKQIGHATKALALERRDGRLQRARELRRHGVACAVELLDLRVGRSPLLQPHEDWPEHVGRSAGDDRDHQDPFEQHAHPFAMQNALTGKLPIPFTGAGTA
jgi:hypothetical protein